MATVSLQAAYDQARRLLESGDTEHAVAVTQHILHHFPRNIEAQRLLGEGYLAGRHLEQAQTAFQTALASDPENIPAYVGLGIAHERQGDLDQAIQSFEHALEIKPDMPELRSQLLRLYTETWGSEGAQLRLSRAGLARLYAKGHMLSQAVQEFRSVISDQPERLDARVALAEVLWRDGQEDAAIANCEAILQDDPYALKPNLLLGYLNLAAGDPQGEEYWNRALELDPYQTVARAMFDQLPFATATQPTLPEWDEQAWQQQREQARVEQERIENDRETRVEPVAAASGAAASSVSDDDFFGGSWMDTIDETPQGQPGAVEAADDDFLARLLAFDGLRTEPDVDDVETPTPFSVDDVAPMADPFSFEEPVAAEQTATDQPGAASDTDQFEPFSLADLGLSEEEIAQIQQNEAGTEEPQSEEATFEPFSLAELGLSEEEIAQIEQNEAQGEQQSAAEDATLTPFSLADLGLSEEEIAALQLDTPEESTQPAGQIGPVTSSVTPSPTTPLADDLGLAPFSFEDEAALSEETSDPDSTPTPPPDDEPALMPFSLQDLGLSEEEIAQLNSAEPGETGSGNDITTVKPFSMEDWGLDDEPNEQPEAVGGDEGFDLPDELRPFSLDDLDINASGGQNTFDMGGLPSSLQPFSLDDISEDVSSSQAAQTRLPAELPQEDEAASATGGYSFRQARSKANTDFGRDQQEADEGGSSSIFAKLRQRHSELPQEELPPLPPVADDEMDMSLFGGDDVSLRDEEPLPSEVNEPSSTAMPAVEDAPSAPTANEEPDMTPFSLADLGLSPEEIAALGLEETPSAEANAPRIEEPSVEQSTAAADEEPELTPFSFSDLGLSPEDIASLDLEEAPSAEANASLPEEPSIFSDTPAANDEPDMTPFSLADLGLSPEEIAALGLGEADTQSTVSQTPDVDPLASFNLDDSFQQSSVNEGMSDQDEVLFDFSSLGEQPTPLTSKGEEEGFDDDIRPFSLDDLGLSDDDIAPFGSGLGNELGLTEEELAGMDLGVFEQAGASTPQQNEDDEQYQVDTGDPILDQLITIGRRQGYVDLDDIIRAVENPEEESERIEEIGLVLHRAGIQIRDGDEIIDMDEEAEEEYEMYAEDEPEEAVAPAVTSTEEPDLTPFSFSDLGLSPEEIASLGLDEATPAEASAPIADEPPAAPVTPAADEEPDMTPFSLADLGLSPEEIAALGLDEAIPAEAPAAEMAAPVAEETPAVEPTPVEAEEPDMTPFSLADLGLSPEEIAALGLDEAIPAETAAPPTEATPVAEEAPAVEPTPVEAEEPDMTPFSLADLGLSPEEIAALDFQETVSPADASEETSDGGDLDTFDFSVAEAARAEVVPAPTQPRIREEEPPPPLSPEDQAFTPKALEELDTIWDTISAQPKSAYVPPTAETPATEQPARPATRDLPPVSERIVRVEKPVREPEAREPERREPERRQPERREPERREPAQPVPSQPQAAPSQPARSARSGSWQMRQSPTAFIPTGDATLDGYLLQLEAEPDNTALRVAVARISGQTNRLDLAVQQYKSLIKGGAALDQVTEDLQELIDDTDDQGTLHRLYRLLGDVYSKQNRFREAVEAYSWTFAK